MEYSSNTQRQLVPTVGQEALGARIQAGSAFAGIGDTVAVGRVLYAGNLPIVPDDEGWIPARERPNRCTIVPFGGVHIFIGETGDRDDDAAPRPARTASELDTFAEDRSGQDPPKDGSALDLENSRPAWTTYELDTSAEDRSE